MNSEISEKRYRHQAEECERNAEQATKAADQLAWLQLAEDWTTLARAAQVNPRRDLDGYSADAAAAG